MKESEINEMVQYYDRFTEIVRQLSMNAEEQILRLKGTVVTDEIASDFSEIGMLYARKLLSNGWISQEQFNLAQNIEEKLEKMTQKRELWNDDALINATEWDSCRRSGKDLLHTLEV